MTGLERATMVAQDLARGVQEGAVSLEERRSLFSHRIHHRLNLETSINDCCEREGRSAPPLTVNLLERFLIHFIIYWTEYSTLTVQHC